VAIVAVACLVAAGGCGQPAAPAPRPAVAPSPGPRVVGVSMFPRSEPSPRASAFTEAANLAVGAGAGADFVSATWSDPEPRQRAYSLDTLAGDVAAGAQRNLAVLVTLSVLNTTAREVPPDLAAAGFDSPAMRQRFHQLLDALRPRLAGHVRYLSIGNEVDVYLAAHPREWAAYEALYGDALAYAHGVLPGVRVGVTTTFAGATGASAAQVARLNRLSDVAILTYYPFGDRFRVRPPTTAAPDLHRMVGVAGGKPLVLQEVGYPSAPELASSEEAQARFVGEVFAAWRAIGAAIPFLSFFLLHDLPRSMCEDLSRYYGAGGDAGFTAFLCTLGLRHRDGTPKPAWTAFSRGASELRAATPGRA
jgi:hypothetical protein